MKTIPRRSGQYIAGYALWFGTLFTAIGITGGWAYVALNQTTRPTAEQIVAASYPASAVVHLYMLVALTLYLISKDAVTRLVTMLLPMALLALTSILLGNEFLPGYVSVIILWLILSVVLYQCLLILAYPEKDGSHPSSSG